MRRDGAEPSLESIRYSTTQGISPSESRARDLGTESCGPRSALTAFSAASNAATFLNSATVLDGGASGPGGSGTGGSGSGGKSTLRSTTGSTFFAGAIVVAARTLGTNTIGFVHSE